MFKITRRKVIIFLILVIVIIGVSYFFLSISKNIPTSTLPSTGVKYNGLAPGISTGKDVTATLGTPVKDTQTGGVRTLEYKSNNPNFNNQFVFKQNVLSFIETNILPADNVDINTIENQYGQNEQALYGPGNSNGFNLYVYPDKGVAYIGNRQINDVSEIWYFPPTDLQTFINLYAQSYSINPNNTQTY